MRYFMATIIAAIGACALTNCTPQPPAPPATSGLSPTEGTVTFTGGAIAVGVGFQPSGEVLRRQCAARDDFSGGTAPWPSKVDSIRSK